MRNSIMTRQTRGVREMISGKNMYIIGCFTLFAFFLIMGCSDNQTNLEITGGAMTNKGQYVIAYSIKNNGSAPVEFDEI